MKVFIRKACQEFSSLIGDLFAGLDTLGHEIERLITHRVVTVKKERES